MGKFILKTCGLERKTYTLLQWGMGEWMFAFLVHSVKKPWDLEIMSVPEINTPMLAWQHLLFDVSFLLPVKDNDSALACLVASEYDVARRQKLGVDNPGLCAVVTEREFKNISRPFISSTVSPSWENGRLNEWKANHHLWANKRKHRTEDWSNTWTPL